MKRCALILAVATLLAGCIASGVPAQTPTASQAPTASRASPGRTPPPTASAGPAGTDTPPAAPSAPPAPVAPAEPSGDAYQWVEVAGGLGRLTYLTAPGDGSGRLFVTEQPGRVRVIQNGQLLDAPFLDITALVDSTGNEQGLLGLAFDPHYSRTGLFYLDFTDTHSRTVIARYRVSSNDPNRADPQSAETVLTIAQPYPNHKGGQLVFGPDGMLWIGMGDGGSQGDPDNRAQDPQELLGKILRIDVSSAGPYQIPPDNPFAGKSGVRPEIWALGLRNPWRFSFDRLTHDLYIADVGQDQWEEIDFAPAGDPGGENYGWNYREGMHAYRGTAPPGLVDPVMEYSHSGGNCAIIGGYVYRGTRLPQLQGVYLYGDFCSGWVWGLWRSATGEWRSKVLFQTNHNLSSFGEDEAGELYLVDLEGVVYRLEPWQPL